MRAAFIFIALVAAVTAQCTYDAVRGVAGGSAVVVLNCSYGQANVGRTLCTAALGPVFAVPTSGAQQFVVTIRDPIAVLATGNCAGGCSSLALGACHDIPTASYWVAVVLECRQAATCTIAMSFTQEAYCGDGICSAVVESCLSCPADCCPSASALPSSSPSASAAPAASQAASQPARSSANIAGGAMAVALVAAALVILLW